MTASPYEARLDSLRRFLGGAQEGVLLSDEVNIGYFTGFFHSEGYLLVTQNSAALLVDFRYYEAAQRQAAGCKVVCFQKLSESLLELLSAENIRRVTAEASHMTVSRFHFFSEKLSAGVVELTADGSLDTRIGTIRIIKDETELEKIAAAQRIAEEAYLELLNDLRPGVSERELSARLEFYMKRKGAEAVSFDLITITGKKTSLPHGVPSGDRVEEGDFFTCDFGAVYEGYHSDTTRTVAVGCADDEMREIYDIVLRAQLAALERIRAGVSCSEVDKTARDIIRQAGYGEYFGHSTGHGVGLNIHELPFVSPKSDTVLRAGMVITDEPGIYLPNRFGVRIEDMVCVTENGCRNFVNLPKQLIIV